MLYPDHIALRHRHGMSVLFGRHAADMPYGIEKQSQCLRHLCGTPTASTAWSQPPPKSIPGILGGGGLRPCRRCRGGAMNVTWTCRELCDCFLMPYGMSAASPLWHGHASGPKFGQIAQTYHGDTVEGVIDLCDRGIIAKCEK